MQQSVPRKMGQEADVSFFSNVERNAKNEKRKIDAKKEVSREERFFIRKEKLHTHTTHLLRLILYYIS